MTANHSFNRTRYGACLRGPVKNVRPHKRCAACSFFAAQSAYQIHQTPMLKPNIPNIAAALLVCSPAIAGTTICKVTGDAFMVKAISWDMDSRKAKVQLDFGEPIDGKVTMVRPHEPYGVKVNLSFAPSNDIYGDELEFMVFPRPKADFRVVGVGYKLVSGAKILNMSLGNNEALCNTL